MGRRRLYAIGATAAGGLLAPGAEAELRAVAPVLVEELVEFAGIAVGAAASVDYEVDVVGGEDLLGGEADDEAFGDELGEGLIEGASDLRAVTGGELVFEHEAAGAGGHDEAFLLGIAGRRRDLLGAAEIQLSQGSLGPEEEVEDVVLGFEDGAPLAQEGAEASPAGEGPDERVQSRAS